MATLPRDRQSKALLQGQMRGEEQLVVSRTVAAAQDTVTYTFPLGFSIQATARGVSFSGSSTNFGEPQIDRILQFIRWARRIHRELKAGRGMMPQSEIKGVLKLRVRRFDNYVVAWYEGYYQSRQEGKTQADAVKALRAMYRTLHAAD